MTTVPVVEFTVAGHATRGSSRPYTVIYDGSCEVCSRLARTLIRWDRAHKLEVVPSQAAGVKPRFPWIPAQAYADALQLVGPQGRTWQGAAAVEQLLTLLPKGKLISWLFKLPFSRPLLNRLYRWFARNRFKLGCGQHCISRPVNVRFKEQ